MILAWDVWTGPFPPSLAFTLIVFFHLFPHSHFPDALTWWVCWAWGEWMGCWLVKCWLPRAVWASGLATPLANLFSSTNWHFPHFVPRMQVSGPCLVLWTQLMMLWSCAKELFLSSDMSECHKYCEQATTELHCTMENQSHERFFSKGSLVKWVCHTYLRGHNTPVHWAIS